MVSCVMCNIAQSNVKTKKLGITYHRFPKNPDKRRAWIKFVNKINWEPTKYTVLCSQHFREECYTMGTNIKRLKETALPTITISRLKWVQTAYIEEHDESQNCKPFLPSTPVLGSDSVTSSVQLLPVVKLEEYSSNNSSPCDQLENTKQSCSIKEVSLVPTVTDSPQEVFLKRKIQEISRFSVIKSEKVRQLQKNNWRQKKKISTLKSIVKQLKEKNLILEVQLRENEALLYNA